MPSEADISEVVENSSFDGSQQILHRIPAPLRFLTDAFVDVTSRVALAQRLIEAQLLDLEIGAVLVVMLGFWRKRNARSTASFARTPGSSKPSRNALVNSRTCSA